MAKNNQRDNYQLVEMFATNNFSNTSTAKRIEEKHVGVKTNLRKTIKQIDFNIQGF